MARQLRTEHEGAIYLVMNRGDRALREGDWKLVSFRGNPWELYNLAEDRTELRDLADEKPELRDRLSARWLEMAEQVDLAPAGERKQLLDTAQPVLHREWSKFKPTAANGPDATPEVSGENSRQRPATR